jgi:DNA-binding XRE family transcriptional regulator
VYFERKPIIILILEDGMKKRKLTGFGIEVKDRLTDINMTQKKLAKEIGLSPVYLSMILYGERSGEKYLDEIKAFLKL